MLVCDTGERQPRSNLVARCPAWAGQARVTWKKIEKMCEWETPRALAARLMFDDVRAALAVLTFLRDMQVGRMVPLALREEWRGEDIGREADRESGGRAGPAV